MSASPPTLTPRDKKLERLAKELATPPNEPGFETKPLNITLSFSDHATHTAIRLVSSATHTVELPQLLVAVGQRAKGRSSPAPRLETFSLRHLDIKTHILAHCPAVYHNYTVKYYDIRGARSIREALRLLPTDFFTAVPGSDIKMNVWLSASQGVSYQPLSTTRIKCIEHKAALSAEEKPSLCDIVTQHDSDSDDDAVVANGPPRPASPTSALTKRKKKTSPRAPIDSFEAKEVGKKQLTPMGQRSHASLTDVEMEDRLRVTLTPLSKTKAAAANALVSLAAGLVPSASGSESALRKDGTACPSGEDKTRNKDKQEAKKQTAVKQQAVDAIRARQRDSSTSLGPVKALKPSPLSMMDTSPTSAIEVTPPTPRIMVTTTTTTTTTRSARESFDNANAPKHDRVPPGTKLYVYTPIPKPRALGSVDSVESNVQADSPGSRKSRPRNRSPSPTLRRNRSRSRSASRERRGHDSNAETHARPRPECPIPLHLAPRQDESVSLSLKPNELGQAGPTSAMSVDPPAAMPVAATVPTPCVVEVTGTLSPSKMLLPESTITAATPTLVARTCTLRGPTMTAADWASKAKAELQQKEQLLMQQAALARQTQNQEQEVQELLRRTKLEAQEFEGKRALLEILKAKKLAAEATAAKSHAFAALEEEQKRAAATDLLKQQSQAHFEKMQLERQLLDAELAALQQQI